MAPILSRYEIGSSESKFSSIERFEIETRERERDGGRERFQKFTTYSKHSNSFILPGK